MIIVTESRKLQYELGNVARLFFPAEKIRWLPCLPREIAESGELVALVEEGLRYDGLVLTILLIQADQEELRAASRFPKGTGEPNRGMEYGKLLYRLLARVTGRQIDWGILTGIRPVKLVRRLRREGATPQEIERFFREEYFTTGAKAALCRLTEEVQRETADSALPHGYSLYISIPFCPSRCSYCSFVSHSTEKSRDMIPEYVEKLCQELEITAAIARDKGLLLQTVYMGGGTPTTLTAPQLERVLTAVGDNFDLTRCTEFTVEAGRPDTITPDKLEVLRRLGADRISVNCQTLNDRVLAAVGRRHTAAEFFTAFELVKQYGFTAINVDLIAGLPGDTLDSFAASLQAVLELLPQNITVHVLTVKRAARLRDDKLALLGEENPETAAMVDLSQRLLAERGYLPYYLYRQKGTVDNLENVGYSLGDTQCRYNVFIMDEAHTILSVGSGGVTKLVMPGEGEQFCEESVRIERIFNLKYPYEYLQRFDTMVAKKHAILDYPL